MRFDSLVILSAAISATLAIPVALEKGFWLVSPSNTILELILNALQKYDPYMRPIPVGCRLNVKISCGAL